MRLVLAALVASTGCAQLFGIEDTTGAGSNTDLASVQIQHVSIGASVIKSPQDMTDQMATFYDDSAGTLAPIPGVQSGTDTFTADATGTPSAIFTLPDMSPQRLWATPALAQRGNYARFEHPSPQEPLPSSQLGVNVALPSPYVTGETFTIQAIGAWSQHGLLAGELPAPDTAVSTIAPPTPLDYSAFGPMITGNAKTRITAADVVLLLRYTTPALSGVFQAQFDQTDGLDSMSGTMTAVAANTPLMAQIDPAAYGTRFATVRPAVAATPSMAWRVTAAPGWSVGSDTGVRLINGTSAAGATPDTAVTAMFGNPFESLDWKAIFVFSASAARTIAYVENGMQGNMNLSSVMTTYSEPSASLNVNMPAGLPITIQANESTLVTDLMTLPLDLTAPVVIHATLDKASNTAYQMQLIELGLDVSGSPVVTRRVVVDAITTGTPDFKLPPELFTVGKSYYITFRCFQGGLVNAATGDLQTLTFPYSTGSLDSAVFTVGMP